MEWFFYLFTYLISSGCLLLKSLDNSLCIYGSPDSCKKEINACKREIQPDRWYMRIFFYLLKIILNFETTSLQQVLLHDNWEMS